ncbi:MAG: pilus assembly protein PilM, partial [Candidatus Gribaldobacteria bacterium]|nr:pilus assembly protein PilM [Candidatus Gribaldobacteria bacterium]
VNHRPLLVIDFGQFRTVFVIFAGQSLRFSSTIPVASKELDNLLMKQLNITLAEAEKIKQTEGLWADSKILDIIVPVLTDLTEQIKKHLDYYHSHSTLNMSHSVEKIVLCGGGANLKGLASFLSDALKIRIELGNPWVNVFSGSHKEILPVSLEESVSYATAIGLALSVSLYD